MIGTERWSKTPHTVKQFEKSNRLIKQTKDCNYHCDQGYGVTLWVAVIFWLFLASSFDSVLILFTFCHSYYGLSVWFPDMIKHLQYEEYKSKIKVR